MTIVVKVLEGRFDEVNNRFDDVQNRFGDMNERFNDMNARMSRMETQNDAIMGAVRDVVDRLARLETRG